MSKHRRRKAPKGRTDGQLTLAGNDLLAATQDAEQPTQFCAVNNADMHKTTDIAPDPEPTGQVQSPAAEAAPVNHRPTQSPPSAQVQRESLGMRQHRILDEVFEIPEAL